METLEEIRMGKKDKRRVECERCRELNVGTPEFVLNIDVINHTQWHIENDN